MSEWFKFRKNQYISDYKKVVSTCQFPRYILYCGIKNNSLQEPFCKFSLMLIIT